VSLFDRAYTAIIFVFYSTVYSRISRKIYDKILPEKLAVDVSPGQNKEIFPATNNTQFPNVPVTNNQPVSRLAVADAAP